MSTTQVSQTLFRFVNVRSPQLTDDVGKDKRFVYRPDAVKSQAGSINVFDAAVAAATGTKWAALTATATTFKASAAYLGTEAALETFAGSSIYKFAAWLARNRDSFTNTELLSKAAAAGAVLTTAKATGLWNNLFYQVITQEFFYMKESIMQLLIANHTLVNLDSRPNANGFLDNTSHAKAHIVLPRELFLENSSPVGFGNRFQDDTTGDPGGSETPAPSVVTTTMMQKLAVANAKDSNIKYAAVIKKIKQIEKEYKKEYQAAYNTEFKTHQEDVVKPLVQQYLDDVEAARVSWCTSRVSGGSFDANDPCGQPPAIIKPTLPEFNFSFQPEMEYLQERLGEESIALINSVHEYELDKTDEDDDDTGIGPGEPTGEENMITADSFEALYNSLNKGIEQNNNVIISNTSTDSDAVVVIGGMSFPVGNNPSIIGTCQNFVATTASSGSRADWFLRIVFENSAVTITNASYQAKTPGGTVIQSDIYYTWIDAGFYSIFSRKPLLHIIDDTRTGFVLKGSFTLNDGYVYNFEITMKQDYAGGIDPFTGLYNLTGSGTMCREITGGGGNETSTVFKPSGFGVKQLGIADYKKVEQTVHCYVEGEVAHIENIMAREYKEKSTRSLRRSENTTTVSSESESEHLSDTTSTDRFEMQNEVAKVIQDSKDFSANASVTASYGTGTQVTINAGANFATHNSKEQSTRAAVTEAKDITQRAMDRVVTRVKQERIEKIIEEFEENNKHGFDNTKGDKHVVGVYRWVDKIYKNQVYNYGKRLMFEFMVPEPGKLHVLGMKDSLAASAGKILVKPTDPRKATQMNIATCATLGETEARYWAGIFNADVEPIPEEFICAGKSFAEAKEGEYELISKTEALEIKEGYKAVAGRARMEAVSDNDYRQPHSFGVTVGSFGRYSSGQGSVSFTDNFNLNNEEGQLSISFETVNFISINISVTVTMQRTNALLSQWKQQTFNTIIVAYEKALAKYEDDLAQQEANAGNIKGANPGFYREIENMVLRKNCLSYLMDQNPAAKLTYGKQMYKTAGKDSFTDYEINVVKALDDYAAFVKFMEQAFEWNIMSYYFYPFYWGSRTDWASLYQYDNNDPIFRSFMQSGMARVVVTVRPGFEDAVRFYMQTGLIWNGGEVPVIDDPMHLSIVDELKEAPGKPEGKAWATRIPTSLTILQADNIGLKVEKALPCNCDDVDIETWENPDAVPCGDNFEITKDILNNGEGNNKLVQFSFLSMYNKTIVDNFDAPSHWPLNFNCMGQNITINRDAAWGPDDSCIVIFEKLAEALSLIPGVTAVQKTYAADNPCGILFTVNGDTVPVFTFSKGDTPSENTDVVRLLINAEAISFAAPVTALDHIFDRYDTALLLADLNKPLPIGRFKV